MKRYMLIKPDENGNCVTFLKKEEVEDIKQLMEDYGITYWKDKDDNQEVMYWGEGWAMLVEYEVKIPKPVQVVQEYTID